MASMAVQYLSSLFLLLFIFPFKMQANDMAIDGDGRVIKKHPNRLTERFEGLKSFHTVRHVNSKSPNTFEDLKYPTYKHPVPKLKPPKTFEEFKTPRAVQPGHKLKSPETFEELKPPIALRPVPRLKPPKTFEELKPARAVQPGHKLKPPKAFEELKPPIALRPVSAPPRGRKRPPVETFTASKSPHIIPIPIPPKTFEESKPPHLEHPIKRPPKYYTQNDEQAMKQREKTASSIVGNDIKN